MCMGNINSELLITWYIYNLVSMLFFILSVNGKDNNLQENTKEWFEMSDMYNRFTSFSSITSDYCWNLYFGIEK